MDDLRNLIWINHVSDSKAKEDLYVFEKPKSNDLSDLDDLDQLLSDIKRLNESVNVYRLNVNTPKFLQKLLKNKEKVSKDKFDIDIKEWLKSNVNEPNELTKLFISNKIYFETQNYKDSLRCLGRLFQLSEDAGDNQWKAISLMEITSYGYGYN